MLLSDVEFTINAAENASTRQTPFCYSVYTGLRVGDEFYIKLTKECGRAINSPPSQPYMSSRRACQRPRLQTKADTGAEKSTQQSPLSTSNLSSGTNTITKSPPREGAGLWCEESRPWRSIASSGKELQTLPSPTPDTAPTSTIAFNIPQATSQSARHAEVGAHRTLPPTLRRSRHTRKPLPKRRISAGIAICPRHSARALRPPRRRKPRQTLLTHKFYPFLTPTSL